MLYLFCITRISGVNHFKNALWASHPCRVRGRGGNYLYGINRQTANIPSMATEWPLSNLSISANKSSFFKELEYLSKRPHPAEVLTKENKIVRCYKRCIGVLKN